MPSKITNPFGDSDEEEEEDDMVMMTKNPFASRRHQGSMRTTNSSSTPSSAGGDSGDGGVIGASSSKKSSSSNPFADDNDNDEEDMTKTKHVSVAQDGMQRSSTSRMKMNHHQRQHNNDNYYSNNRKPIAVAAATVDPFETKPSQSMMKSRNATTSDESSNKRSAVRRNSTNPFDFEPNFEPSYTPRYENNVRASMSNNNYNHPHPNSSLESKSKSKSKSKSTTMSSMPLAKSMDSDEIEEQHKVITTTTTTNARSLSTQHTPTKSTPPSNTAKSSTTTTTIHHSTTNANTGITGWLRGSDSRNTSANTTTNAKNNNNNSTRSSNTIASKKASNIPTTSTATTATSTKVKVKNKAVPIASSSNNYNNNKNNNTKKQYTPQKWPYDDYHKHQQQKITQKQQEKQKQKQQTKQKQDKSSSNSSSSNNTTTKRRFGRKHNYDDAYGYGAYHSDEDDPIPTQSSSSSNNNNNNNNNNSKNKLLFERPPELPTIREAVRDLSLFEFERAAEERAISIVGTWLFDAGLIDELMVHGSSNSAAAAAAAAASASASSNLHHSISSNSSVGNSSVKSQEGIELGAHGFPILGGIDGGLKMDREIGRLREEASAELNLVDARLNDGVAASGEEVRELVSAVDATQNDLGRLRELTTYISSGGGGGGAGVNDNGNSTGSAEEKEKTLMEQQQQQIQTMDSISNTNFLLEHHPKLRKTIHARRNLFRCFRELEFFSQIPSTCERLREDLHRSEWTEDEYVTLRHVCMEHVELEILLVEAEAGMKARIDEEDYSTNQRRSSSSTMSSSLLPSTGNHGMVDDFLSQHVKNVWELGEEIRVRILSGIGTSFDLALQNPAGMVALVEAVEVYERASMQYQAVQSRSNTAGDTGRLKFTNMRADALSTLFQDFELRGLEVFRAIHMQAADSADVEGKDAMNQQFNGVLRAATELVTEIDVVKHRMAPCFAPHWHVEMLWSSCVAHVCSNQIIQQIGGPEGNNLSELSVTQLLDLVAWVEFFRESIEEAFPSVITLKQSSSSDPSQGGAGNGGKAYFDAQPDLFDGTEQRKEVNVLNAIEGLAWVNNMLWDVHRLAQDEFLMRTRTQTSEWLAKTYSNELEGHENSEGRLTTSLCEDVFSLMSIHLNTIRQRLSKKSDALVVVTCLMFSQLRLRQIESRDTFLKDIETCCAAANDFQRMGEKCEDILQEILDESDFPEGSIGNLEASANELLALYSADSVYAAQKAHLFVFRDIEENITDLFEAEWESELTHNEMALSLTQTLEDFMGDFERFLDDFMLKKTVDALVTSSVLFYVRTLLLKSEKHNSNRVSYFQDNEVALQRIDGDIHIIRNYFEGYIDGMPALKKVIEKDFEILTTIQELLRIAAGFSESDAGDFICVMHKRIKDVDITKNFVGDLWHLIQPTQERMAFELVESMEENLEALCPSDGSASKNVKDRMNVPGLRIDEMLAKMYVKSERKRPKANAMERLAKNWKANWITEE